MARMASMRSRDDYDTRGAISNYQSDTYGYNDNSVPSAPEPIIREEPYLGFTFSMEFFDKIVGFNYSNINGFMRIRTIPKYVDNPEIIVLEETFTDTRPDLYPELDHLNSMYRDYMEETRRQRAREVERARTREATQVSQMVARQLRPDDGILGVSPYARAAETTDGSAASLRSISDSENEDVGSRLADTIFGVRDRQEERLSEAIEEEVQEILDEHEVETPSLSFQTGSRFMEGNNHDE